MPARAAALAVLLFFAARCDGGGPPLLPAARVSLAVDAGTVTGTLEPLWRDHYDLSYTHLEYEGEAGLAPNSATSSCTGKAPSPMPPIGPAKKKT